MKFSRRLARIALRVCALCVVVMGVAPRVASAQGTYFLSGPVGVNSPYNFTDGLDGATPYAGLTIGRDGNFYGTAYGGGLFGNGSIYMVDKTTGAYTTLYSFTAGNDGQSPVAGLIQGQVGDNAFYGLSYFSGAGAYGTIFKCQIIGTILKTCALDPNTGLLPTLYSFTGDRDGGNPIGGLVQARDGSFWGTTGFEGMTLLPAVAGASAGIVAPSAAPSVDNTLRGNSTTTYLTGVVIQEVYTYSTAALSVDLTKETLAGPASSYVTTDSGLLDDSGNPDGSANTAILTMQMSSNPAVKWIRLWRQVAGGGYYLVQSAPNVTSQTWVVKDGSISEGTIFRCVILNGVCDTTGSSDGLLSPVYRLFSGNSDGSSPQGALLQGQGTDNAFYGTTWSGGPSDKGTLFKIDPATGAFRTLYSFTAAADGGLIQGSLVQTSNGSFWGTTFKGGNSGNATIFKCTVTGAAGSESCVVDGTGLLPAYQFSGGADGGQPLAGLVLSTDGSLYASTWYGTISNAGTVVRCTPTTSGTAPCVVDSTTHLVPTLYTFSITDGNGPNALVQSADGSFWGTTSYGGAFGVGTIFRLSPLPVVSGPASVIVNATSAAGTLVTLNATVIDPANPNITIPATTVTWTIDGVPVQTDTFVTGPTSPAPVSMAATYPAGTHTVTLSVRDTATTVPTAVTTYSTTVEVDKIGQTITFAQPANQTFNNPAPTVTLSATSSSALPVTLTVAGPATLAGNVLTLTGAGSITVTASQPGDGQYNAATNVVRTFTVAKGTQTITFAQPPALAFSNGLAVTLPATSSSGLAVTLALTSTTPAGIATLTGNVLSISAIGSIVVTATQPGDSNWNAATNTGLPRTITVSKGPQTITFANPGPLTFGTAPVALGATASSGLAVTYAVASGPGTVSGSTLTVTGVGTIVINASQAGNANFNAATAVQQSVVVNKANQTITFNAVPPQTPGTSVALVATATSGIPVSFTFVSGPGSLSGNTLTSSAVGTIVVRASQVGNANYNAAADVLQSITVGQATQTIAFTAVPAQTFGGSPVTLVATATSGLTVTFAVTSGPGTVSGNQLTPTGAGTIVVTASQAGNASYIAAPDVPQSIVVGKGNQTIAFSPTAAPAVGGPAVTLVATATSGLPVTFTFVSGPGLLLGNQLTATGFGTIVVKASQAGNANYNAAPDVTQNVAVAKTNQTITFPVIASPTFGAAPVALAATASSALPVTYSIVSGPGSVSGSTLTITGAGTIVVKASQAGNSAYNAAPDVSQSITVNKATLTITTVAASRNYGLANPAFTVAYAGFVSGNGPTSLTGTLTFTTSATTTSTPGTYSVTPGGVTSANYAITFVAGTLTVLDIAPVAANDVATTATGTAVTISVLANDAHAVGTLTITAVTTPAHGTAAISGQSIVYTPASGYVGADSFTYTENDGFGGTSTGTVTLTVGNAVSALGRFVAFSKDLTWLHASAMVTTGDIGANLSRGHDHGDGDDHDGDHHDGDHHGDGDDDHDHWSGNGHGDDDDDDSVTVRLDAGAVMQQTTSRVVGDTVELAAHSSIYGLVKNSLVNHGGAILGTTVNTMAVPYLTLPVFPSISAGTTSVTVTRNTTKTLAPGKYGAIHVEGGAKLILSGGLYQIVSLDVDQSATVLFRAAVDLRIKTSLNADTSSQIITDPTVSGLKASQIKIYVASADDDGGCHNRYQDSSDDEFGGEVAVNIGENAIVKANIYAPNGTVWLKTKAQGTGAFIGEHVQVGPNAKLTLDSGF